MAYDVRIAAQAADQLQKAAIYIASDLGEPVTARKWADRMYSLIRTLKEMPYRYPLTPVAPEISEPLRKMPAENFNAYYYIDEANKTVEVVAFIYGRRDQKSALTDPLDFPCS